MTNKISAILLAGGIGSRMKSSKPKQFLSIKHKPIILYSLEAFQQSSYIDEIIIVCSKEYHHLFNGYENIKFAQPGERRQDSVYNGLQQVANDSSLVCIHDSARPFISTDIIKRTLEAAINYGASTTGMPVVFTVKQADDSGFVEQTIDRSKIWEIQTPQALQKKVLIEGFKYAKQNNITVTDDASLAEIIGKPVKLIEGSRNNIKITTPEDLNFAEKIIEAL